MSDSVTYAGLVATTPRPSPPALFTRLTRRREGITLRNKLKRHCFILVAAQGENHAASSAPSSSQSLARENGEGRGDGAGGGGGSEEDLLMRAFGRRVALGASAASVIALGGNLGGITSFLLSFDPRLFRRLKLDVVYPIKGFKRCLEQDFEFIYPDTWVGDQRLLYRAAEKLEKELQYSGSTVVGSGNVRQNSFVEPVVAFGPPGSTGELNVSVIVAPVASGFRLEKFGSPKEAGEAILRNSIVSRSPNLSINLIGAQKHDEVSHGEQVSYYSLEFTVKGESFKRHNVAVYATHDRQLFSMNAQTPDILWTAVKEQFQEMVSSFKVRY